MRFGIVAVAFALIAASVLAVGHAVAQTSPEGIAQATTPSATDSTAAPATTAPAEPAPAGTTTPAPATTTPPATTAPAQTAPPPAQAPAAQTAPPPAQAAPAQTAPPPAQQSSQPSGPFDRGRTRASFTAGWGRSFGDDYLLLGVGLGRFIKTGLELGLSYEQWVGSDPGVSKLSPEINYVLTRAPRVTPYVGAFYTRAFIDGFDDLSSIGGRAGIYRGRGRTSYGVGAVYENYLDCDDAVYGDCSTVYPEVFVSASF
jgi:hypothetical protein